jgi:hypothetical protein
MEKVAGMDKKADPYTMNQEHANNPVEKYKTGDPSTWAEDPDMKTPWKAEGRTEDGHPAPAREAVKAARKLEDKALKCITIAQRMLPGANDGLIEEQATDLMYLPENSVLATLQRQSRLAEVLAKGDDDEDDDDADKAAAAKCEKEPEEKKEEVVEAKKEEVIPEEKKEEVVEAKKEEVVPEEKKEEVVEAKKADPKDEEIEMDKEASSDLLDLIFAQEEPKTGAKKLSGIVKQASSSEGDLSGLWNAPPDVSKAFR